MLGDFECSDLTGFFEVGDFSDSSLAESADMNSFSSSIVISWVMRRR